MGTSFSEDALERCGQLQKDRRGEGTFRGERQGGPVSPLPLYPNPRLLGGLGPFGIFQVQPFHLFQERGALEPQQVGRGEGEKKTFKSLMVAGMHFMDAYNYDTARARRCVIHYSTPDARLYSFCTYNAGPCHRDATERRQAQTPAEYQARTK